MKRLKFSCEIKGSRRERKQWINYCPQVTNKTATNQYSIDRYRFDKNLIGRTFSEARKTFQQQATTNTININNMPRNSRNIICHNRFVFCHFSLRGAKIKIHSITITVRFGCTMKLKLWNYSFSVINFYFAFEMDAWKGVGENVKMWKCTWSRGKERAVMCWNLIFYELN